MKTKTQGHFIINGYEGMIEEELTEMGIII